MKKYSVLLLVTIAFPLSFSYGMPEYSADEFKAYVENKLASIDNYELQYMGWMNLPEANVRGGFNSDFWDKQIENLQDVLQKKKSGEFSSVAEAKSWSNVPLEKIEADIQKLEGLKNGHKFESFYVFSKKGDKQRVDVYRSNDSTNHHYYLYDGKKGYVIFPEREKGRENITTSSSYTRRWKSPIKCGGYGFNLIGFLDAGFTVQNMDSAKNQLTVTSKYHNPTVSFVFQLFEDYPEYWKKVDLIDQDGLVIESVDCNDFQLIGDYLTPQTITVKKRGNTDLYDHISLTLVEAKINDAVFPDGFFDCPTGSQYITKNYNR